MTILDYRRQEVWLVRRSAVSRAMEHCSAGAAQAATEAHKACIRQLTVQRQQLGAQLAAHEEALAGAVNRLSVADFLLQTPPEGDPAKVMLLLDWRQIDHQEKAPCRKGPKHTRMLEARNR